MDVDRLGPVRIVGAGMIGTSLGLALTALGVRVLLADASPDTRDLACDLGAGEPDTGEVTPRLIVVATPPDVTAGVVAAALAECPQATVTDVASVKTKILTRLRALGADLTRYVGSHPMAGRERSGPTAGRGDLFVTRPWVVCPTSACDPLRVAEVHELAAAVGAAPVVLDAAEHDDAVALVSHVPQIAASLVAARLRAAPQRAVDLAGQGVRDVTRIAASDPQLWTQILASNAGPVAAILRDLRHDLDAVLEALDRLATGAYTLPAGLGLGSPTPSGGTVGGVHGERAALAAMIAHGNDGRDRIPGKHGSNPTPYSVCTVVVPDRPGQLARLFTDIGAAGVNVEEISLEHAPGRAVGLVQLSVLPGAAQTLVDALIDAGWALVG